MYAEAFFVKNWWNDFDDHDRLRRSLGCKCRVIFTHVSSFAEDASSEEATYFLYDIHRHILESPYLSPARCLRAPPRPEYQKLSLTVHPSLLQ